MGLLSTLLRKGRELRARVLLERLEAEPLGTLDSVATEDRGIARTFLASYRGLKEVDRTVLQALAACAAGTRSEIVAAVAGVELEEATSALNRLADGSLAEHIEGAEAPWSLHDVVRLFVRAQEGRKEADGAHLAWVEEHLDRHRDPEAYRELEKGVQEGLVVVRRLLGGGEVEKAERVFEALFAHLRRRGELGVVVEESTHVLESMAEESEGAARWLGNLGLCYQTLGELPKAIDHHQRALAINEQIGRLEGQANQLVNLGICYWTLGHISKAIESHQRALTIHEQIGSVAGQAIALGNLGLCDQTLGEIPRAIESHQRALAIHKQIGTLEGQATQLGSLGACYQSLGDLPKAIDHLEQSLALCRRMELPEDHPKVTMVRETLERLEAYRRSGRG